MGYVERGGVTRFEGVGAIRWSSLQQRVRAIAEPRLIGIIALVSIWCLSLWCAVLAYANDQQPHIEDVPRAMQWLAVLALFGLFGGAVRELILWRSMPWQRHGGFVLGAVISCWLVAVPALLRAPDEVIVALVVATAAGFGGTFIADTFIRRWSISTTVTEERPPDDRP